MRTNQTKFYICRSSTLVIFICLLCCKNQISTEDSETTTKNVKCNIGTKSTRCLDETNFRKIFNGFVEIPETTQYLRIDCNNLVEPFASHAFKNLKNLKGLEIRYCSSFRLRQVPSNLQNLEFLLVSSEHLSKINSTILPNLKNLSFTRYSPEDMSSDAFCSFPQIEHLKIDTVLTSNITTLHCKSSHACCSSLESVTVINGSPENIFITQEAFRGVTNLKSLYLKGVKIDFSQSISNDWNKLIELRLQINSISFFPDDFFLPLQNVRFLDLSWNRIASKFLPQLNPLISLESLDLSHNKFTCLSLDFQVFPHLRSLKLIDNIIIRISSKSFKDCYNITSIDLSDNSLRSLTDEEKSTAGTNVFTSKDLPKLRNLNLGSNKMERLDYSMIPISVKILYINHNPLSSFTANDSFCDNHTLQELNADCTLFMNLENSCFPSSIKKLSLENTMIWSLPTKTFSTLTNLNELRLGGSKLVILERFAFSTPVNIILNPAFYTCGRSFNNRLSHVKSESLCESKIYSIKTISLQADTFIHVCQYVKTCSYLTCDLCVNLTILDCGNLTLQEVPWRLPSDSTEVYLDGNNLTSVDLDKILAVYQIVRVLYLNNSNIHHIGPSNKTHQHQKHDLRDISLTTFPTIQQLFLQDNRLTVLHHFSFSSLNRLQELHLERNAIREIRNNAFYSLNRLTKLYVQSNHIKEIKPGMFYRMNQLEELHVGNNFIANISSIFKPFKNLTKLHMNDNRITILSSRAFSDNKLIREIHLERNMIETLNMSFFQDLPCLVSLYLNNNSLRKIFPDQSLLFPSLEELYLEYNQLSILNGKEFKGLIRVNKLFLHHNKIHSINKVTFEEMVSLETLTLHDNNLQQAEMFNFILPTTVTKLTIQRNPIRCKCQDLGDLIRLLIKDNIIPNASDVKCVSKENENYYTPEEYLLQFCNRKKLIVVLSVSIGMLLLIVFVCVLIYKYRLELQVILYSRFNIRFFRNNSTDELKPFHAFVAYSFQDRGFVANHLVPGLADYRLCLHDRDFIVGVFIQKNIIGAINSSCCTVIVFSTSFARSQWCRFEFRTAHEKTLSLQRRPLILIVLEDVDPREMDDEMKVYMNTTTYLRWGDKLFWEKLKFALPTLNENDNERNDQRPIPLLRLDSQ